MAEKKRQHRATYAKDKMRGGYIIRIEGPYSNRFAGKEVPVTLKDGGEQQEMLADLIWSGKDTETNAPVSLYYFVPTESAEKEIIF